MNPLDPVEFRRQGHMVIDFLADYYQNINNYPVRSQVTPGYLLETLPDCAPLLPDSTETILNDVVTEIIPGITHWQSPNFFGYFASSGSTASFLGEMLLNGFNVVGFNWQCSPAATELEMVVMEWLSKLLQLPQSFSFSSNSGGGALLGTTCEAFICTLLAKISMYVWLGTWCKNKQLCSSLNQHQRALLMVTCQNRSRLVIKVL